MRFEEAANSTENFVQGQSCQANDVDNKHTQVLVIHFVVSILQLAMGSIKDSFIFATLNNHSIKIATVNKFYIKSVNKYISMCVPT